MALQYSRLEFSWEFLLSDYNLLAFSKIKDPKTFSTKSWNERHVMLSPCLVLAIIQQRPVNIQ